MTDIKKICIGVECKEYSPPLYADLSGSKMLDAFTNYIYYSK